MRTDLALIASAGILLTCGGDAKMTSEPTPPEDASTAEAQVEARSLTQPTSPAEPNRATVRDGTVARADVLRATRNGSAAYLMSQLEPAAHRPGGRFAGWRIGAVFPDDPDLCSEHCAIEVGDIVLSVNGSPIERPEQLSALLESLGTITELNIVVRREAQLLRLRYRILDE